MSKEESLVVVRVTETEFELSDGRIFEHLEPLDGSIVSGRRVHRGLYEASDGRRINADVNGSANIGRKVFRDDDGFIVGLDRSVAATPERIDALKVFSNNQI